MKEAKGDLFKVPCDALCITTNGFVKRDGQAVMGRGCAKQLAQLWPDTPKVLGRLLAAHGNRVNVISAGEPAVLSFPVKPASAISDGSNFVSHMHFPKGNVIPGWACKADLELIKTSAHQLVELTDRMGYRTVILPRPGCGAGELDWETVRPVLAEILDDRFTCYTF